MNKNHIIIGIIGVMLIAGIAFWGGITYAQGSGASQRNGSGTFVSRNGGRFNAGGGNVFGAIVAKDANSITIQLGGPNASSTNGNNTGSKIVILDNATQIGKFVSGSQSDLSVGQNVMVAGSANSDGSITAQSIQIRPASSFRPRGQ